MSVYKAIAAVMGELAQTGISKSRRNQQQNYSFRGIDDVYNALAPIMAKHGLAMLPRVISRDCVERTTAKGGVLFYVVCQVEFDLVCAEDGSKHVISTYGEAMDSADKATNKAMSAALKYACLQTFMIPTEGDNDADATTHDVKAETVGDTMLGQIRDALLAAGIAEAKVAGAYGLRNLADLPAAKGPEVLAKALAKIPGKEAA